MASDIDGLLYVVCGAFLYDVYHVITAAHCVPNNITISSIYLSFGRWHLLSVEPWEQLKGVQQIIRHGSFNEETLENDIAILRLSDSVVFNTFVHPVCLPTTPAAEGEDGLIMGWGTTIDTGDSDYLQAGLSRFNARLIFKQQFRKVFMCDTKCDERKCFKLI